MGGNLDEQKQPGALAGAFPLLGTRRQTWFQGNVVFYPTQYNQTLLEVTAKGRVLIESAGWCFDRVQDQLTNVAYFELNGNKLSWPNLFFLNNTYTWGGRGIPLNLQLKDGDLFRIRAPLNASFEFEWELWTGYTFWYVAGFAHGWLME